MGKKKALNAKRLTKAQVQELIESEGKLHEEFTRLFEEIRPSGHKNQPQVYKLPNDRFLYVFDPQGWILPGKGNIYSKEQLLRSLQWRQKVREDYANHRGSSGEHWRYYSKHKEQLIDRVSELVDELGDRLEIPTQQLDFSYKSLDVVSSKSEAYGLEKIQAELYDNLVCYVGEVLRRRVKGEWVIEHDSSGKKYPAICANQNILMPINVVFKEIDGYEPMNLRKETANEVRRFSLRIR